MAIAKAVLTSHWALALPGGVAQAQTMSAGDRPSRFENQILLNCRLVLRSCQLLPIQRD